MKREWHRPEELNGLRDMLVVLSGNIDHLETCDSRLGDTWKCIGVLESRKKILWELRQIEQRLETAPLAELGASETGNGVLE